MITPLITPPKALFCFCAFVLVSHASFAGNNKRIGLPVEWLSSQHVARKELSEEERTTLAKMRCILREPSEATDSEGEPLISYPLECVALDLDTEVQQKILQRVKIAREYGLEDIAKFTWKKIDYFCSSTSAGSSAGNYGIKHEEQWRLLEIIDRRASQSTLKELNLGPYYKCDETTVDSKTKTTLISTTNKHGNIVLSPSPLIQIFRDSIESGQHILEIGSAEGHETFQILARGAHTTSVEVSFIATEQAKCSLDKSLVSKELLKRSNFISGHFPDCLSSDFSGDNESLFDSVLMSHVAHYLTGEELRKGLGVIHGVLKPDGIFYFQSLTPYSAPHIDDCMDFERRKANGDQWPGEYSKEASAGWSGAMPLKGHPVDPEILERELLRAGFEIHYLNFGPFSWPKLQGKEQDLLWPEDLGHRELMQWLKSETSHEEIGSIEEQMPRSLSEALIAKGSRESYAILRVFSRLAEKLRITQDYLKEIESQIIERIGKDKLSFLNDKTVVKASDEHGMPTQRLIEILKTRQNFEENIDKHYVILDDIVTKYLTTLIVDELFIDKKEMKRQVKNSLRNILIALARLKKVQSLFESQDPDLLKFIDFNGSTNAKLTPYGFETVMAIAVKTPKSGSFREKKEGKMSKGKDKENEQTSVVNDSVY